MGLNFLSGRQSSKRKHGFLKSINKTHLLMEEYESVHKLFFSTFSAGYVFSLRMVLNGCMGIYTESIKIYKKRSKTHHHIKVVMLMPLQTWSRGGGIEARSDDSFV